MYIANFWYMMVISKMFLFSANVLDNRHLTIHFYKKFHKFIKYKLKRQNKRKTNKLKQKTISKDT